MNPTIAYVILGATVAVFLTFGVLAFTVLRRVRYPTGRRIDLHHSVYGMITTIVDNVVVLDPAKHRVLAEAGVRAIVCVADAWREYEGGKRWEPSVELHDFCFYFMADADYEAAWKGDLTPRGPVTAAVRGQLARAIGSGPLCAVIRASLIDHCIDRGAPAIHEAIHGLAKWDSNHVWKEVWGDGTSATVEGRAYAKFKVA